MTPGYRGQTPLETSDPKALPEFENRIGRPYAALVEAAVEKSVGDSVVARIWQKDPTVWKDKHSEQNEITNRLGWLDAPRKSQRLVDECVSFADGVRREGVRHIVLFGMGGSSLAPEVFFETFGRKEGYPGLIVLDSTDPEKVRDARSEITINKTLFIFSSKSGTTTEPLSLYKYFRAETERSSKAAAGREAGRRFVAVTDPGTSLEDLARSSGFRRVFYGNPEVGGRFSALTAFGLLPAALTGADVRAVLKSAQAFAERAKENRRDNPALVLGAAMAVLSLQKKDKLTFIGSKHFARFGDWVEQLVAESTGKEGRGIVPVIREDAAVACYGSDRFFAALVEAKDAAAEKKLAEIRQAGHPSIVIRARAREDIGAEFFRWEMATAIAGAILHINPFDQPNVQETKDRTKTVLKDLEAGRKIGLKTQPVGAGLLRGRASGAVGQKNSWVSFWKSLRVREAVHVLAFLPDRPPVRRALEKIRDIVRARTKSAVTLGFGPRYLHSTGQLHKGGADNGIFLMMTADRRGRIPIPGEKISFEELELAQAIGDYQALESRGRRVLWIELSGFGPTHLGAVEKAVSKTLSDLS